MGFGVLLNGPAGRKRSFEPYIVKQACERQAAGNTNGADVFDTA